MRALLPAATLLAAIVLGPGPASAQRVAPAEPATRLQDQAAGARARQNAMDARLQARADRATRSMCVGCGTGDAVVRAEAPAAPTAPRRAARRRAARAPVEVGGFWVPYLGFIGE